MKTLKTEEVDGRRFKDIEHARRFVSVFIDTIYNTERLHSALGNCPPVEFETNFALKTPCHRNYRASLMGCSPVH